MVSELVTRPTLDQVWDWLRAIPDPEIPVVSVVDLGIVRDVRWQGQELVVAITPTYSGCPATGVIALAIESELLDRGVEKLRLERRLSPPWTTDWISAEGRRQLRAYGIAPPPETGAPVSLLDRFTRPSPAVQCPRCGSADTVRVSAFGSTPCKAQYRCQGCLEPFDQFKCI